MQFITKLTLIACLLGVMTEQVNAWSGWGHLVVSRIAHDLLMENNPKVVDQVEDILSILKKADMGTWTKKEGKHPMVECVCYADDIKYKGGVYQSQWHFLNIPYFDEGGDMDDFKFKYPKHNITEALDGIRMWMNKEKGYDKTYIYEQIIGHTNSTEEGLSSAMRFLLHLVGDAHQPLHSTARVNSRYPRGDMGANAFHLPNHYGAKNLHSVWDKVLYEFKYYPKLPFSDDDWDALGETAQKYLKKYKVTKKVKDILDPEVWSEEAYEISTSFVYEGIKEDEELPQEYIDEGKEIAERQLVIAGYRLYNLLNGLQLSKHTNGSKFQSLYVEEPVAEAAEVAFLQE